MKWRILLVQSFTARVPLLMATSAFRLGKNAGVHLNSVIHPVSIPLNSVRALHGTAILAFIGFVRAIVSLH